VKPNREEKLEAPGFTVDQKFLRDEPVVQSYEAGKNFSATDSSLEAVIGQRLTYILGSGLTGFSSLRALGAAGVL
jgi:hypothetical protein